MQIPNACRLQNGPHRLYHNSTSGHGALTRIDGPGHQDKISQPAERIATRYCFAFGSGPAWIHRLMKKPKPGLLTSSRVSRAYDVPERPMRAARPDLWTNSFGLAGKSKWTTLSRSGMSIPLAATSVTTSRLTFPALNLDTAVFLAVCIGHRQL